MSGSPRSVDLRKPKEPAGTVPRNTRRGIRSSTATEERRHKRSIKRNLARRQKRKRRALAGKAQEPEEAKPQQALTTLKISLETEITCSTVNIRGMKRAGKREEVEQYMRRQQIKLLLLQETHINCNARESRKHFTWFFSGDETQATPNTHAGVAIVICNDLLNYIQEIEPIDDRIMYMTLGHTMPVTFVNVYAPTAEHDTETKESFYTKLRRVQIKKQKKGPTYTCGAFNARAQARNHLS